MKAYKLTDENHCSRGKTKWGENVSHTATGISKDLCTNGWIHFYTDPHLAVFMNPIHAKFKNPVLWECETSGEHLHEALKSGCKTLTTIKQIPLPEVTLTQKIAFGILCAMEVYKEPNWTVWADKWLSGEDRTYVAASYAASASDAASYAASASDAASYAASASASASDAAAASVRATDAEAVSYDASYAAAAAAAANKDIIFTRLISKALKVV